MLSITEGSQAIKIPMSHPKRLNIFDKNYRYWLIIVGFQGYWEIGSFLVTRYLRQPLTTSTSEHTELYQYGNNVVNASFTSGSMCVQPCNCRNFSSGSHTFCSVGVALPLYSYHFFPQNWP